MSVARGWRRGQGRVPDTSAVRVYISLSLSLSLSLSHTRSRTASKYQPVDNYSLPNLETRSIFFNSARFDSTTISLSYDLLTIPRQRHDLF